MKKILIYFLFISLSCVGCGSTKNTAVTNTTNLHQSPIIRDSLGAKPKNIILMIGDGMGLTQITAGIYNNDNFMNIELFPYTGLMKTQSADNLVTDSAASATAIACGVKTYNNAVGVDENGVPVKTILEEAEDKGLLTGIVVTSTVVNATPAAFMAHQKLRGFSEPIAEDVAVSGVDFLVGGGKRYFDMRDADDRDLISEMREKGYQITDHVSHSNIKKIKFEPNKKFVYFTANNNPLTRVAGRKYLPYASKIGADFLKERSDKGFFMMIEGSQVDWGGHAANIKYTLSELKDFDQAIKEIYEFAKTDGETLVIVTADHETGGLSIQEGSRMNKLKTNYAYGRHTATMVPVFAFGPGAENFTGIFDNTDLYRKMKALLKL